MYLAVYLKLSIIYKVSGRKIFPFIALVLLRYKFIPVGKNVGSKRIFLIDIWVLLCIKWCLTMHAHKTLAPISNISMDRLHHEVLTLELSNIIIKRSCRTKLLGWQNCSLGKTWKSIQRVRILGQYTPIL